MVIPQGRAAIEHAALLIGIDAYRHSYFLGIDVDAAHLPDLIILEELELVRHFHVVSLKHSRQHQLPVGGELCLFVRIIVCRHDVFDRRAVSERCECGGELFGGELGLEFLGRLGQQNGIVSSHVGIVERHQRGADKHVLFVVRRNFGGERGRQRRGRYNQPTKRHGDCSKRSLRQTGCRCSICNDRSHGLSPSLMLILGMRNDHLALPVANCG